VADLPQARECLRAILASSSEVGVPLPNVKRLFRSRFQLDLSETALGHSRISELLQDVRFQDICTMQLRGNTYVVVPSQGAAAGEASAVAKSSHEVPCEVVRAPREQAVSERTEEQSPLWQSYAARTFLHFKSSLTTSVRRSSSVPKDHRSGRNADLSPSDSVSTEATEADLTSPHRLRFCPDEPLGLEEACSAECIASVGFPLMTPSPQYEVPCYGVRGTMASVWSMAAGAASSFEALGFQIEEGLPVLEAGEGRVAGSSAVAGGEAQPDAPPRRVQFCPEEPLSLEEAFPTEPEMTFNFAVVTPSPQYEQPPRSWMPAACSTRIVPEVTRPSGREASCEAISLFRTLGLVAMDGIEAIAEASESESESLECERTPMCAEPLSLDDDDSDEEGAQSQAPLGFPLMTPSPAYHSAASARYASLRYGQQLPHPKGQAILSTGARFESFPCVLQQPILSTSHQPRLAAVGGA